MALKANFYIISILFYYLLSFFFVFALRQTGDGADFPIFTISVLLALIVFFASILFNYNCNYSIVTINISTYNDF